MLQFEYGLVIWTTLAFLITWGLLGKMAWKPILKSLKDREDTIDSSLKEAVKAREEIANMKSDNEKLLQQAREERDKMLTEARETKESIVAEAKGKAQEEGDRMIEAAREAIKNEKMAAQTEIKNMVAQLSIEIAEKIVKEQLNDSDKQNALVNNLIDEVNLN